MGIRNHKFSFYYFLDFRAEFSWNRHDKISIKLRVIFKSILNLANPPVYFNTIHLHRGHIVVKQVWNGGYVVRIQ